MHKDLRFAGQLPPLEAPHHPRADEWPRYREGAVVASPQDESASKSNFVNVGLSKVRVSPF
jgi:hypothetical protein